MVKRIVPPQCGIAPSADGSGATGFTEAHRQSARRDAMLRRQRAQRAQDALDGMAMTADQYRQDIIPRISKLLDLAASMLTPTDVDGFSFAPEVRSEVASINGAILALLEDGLVECNTRRQNAVVTGYRAEIARADDGFAGMLDLLKGVSQ